MLEKKAIELQQILDNTIDGKKVFGIFFNGFYLPHELGHALQYATADSSVNLEYKK